MELQKIRDMISKMTLEEKASFTAGQDFWRLQQLDRLGIPKTMVSDGPHGLRKQSDEADNLGINDSIKAVCFPAGCAMAASFDRDLMYRQGETIGREAQAEDVSVVLGPAMNIKRSPLCGRNFEYLSEDPLAAGEMAAALIRGIQSQNIGTSPKHFAANSQEYHRMTNSSEVDERTFREIYLANFETAVKKAHPWTIMNSYNRINGTYTCEDRELLTDILRNEWGFDGYVVTDWGAMNDRVEALKAGCDLEMPGPGGQVEKVIGAVRSGALDERILDETLVRLLDVIFRYAENRKEAVFEYEKDHAFAAEAAENSMVLLKNEDGILPLSCEKTIAFIGQYAKKPRFQGGGSSHINCFRMESALEAAKTVVPDTRILFAKGFDDSADASDEKLIAEAVEAAKAADTAVVFAGLPDSFESEGYDRKHLSMPKSQIRLIEAVADANPDTVVVLHNGSAIEMPWLRRVKAVLESYLGGQAVGPAQVRILFGKANPSGRLAESFPLRLEDTPSYLTFGGEDDRVCYSEGVFVGYRWYTSRSMPVLFPFGYGLSYTSFEYSGLRLSGNDIAESDGLTVQVDVMNTGAIAGKEVVQLYVGAPERKPNKAIRPVRELRAFEKISLEPGETKTVTMKLDSRAFAYWNTQIHDWFVDTEDYVIEICRDAQTPILTAPVHVRGEKIIPKHYTLTTTLGELMSDPDAAFLIEEIKQTFGGDSGGSEAISDEMTAAMMEGMPLRSVPGFCNDITMERLEDILKKLNAGTPAIFRL